MNNIEKLNDVNYETWATQMMSALQIKRLSKYVKSAIFGEADSEGNEDCLAYMSLAVKPNQLRHLKGATNAFEGWTKLKETHHKTGPAYEMMFFRQLLNPCAVD